jgi:hypothetical protein
MGGYNRTISIDRGSPIAGRQAWSGNSAGFITTVVNIPGFGSQARLRWRMASDTSGSGEGWRVDTVNITACVPVPRDNYTTGPCQPPTPTPPITPTPTVTPTVNPTVTPTVTPRISPTPTPTATATPRATPRPRPSPHPRPSP